VVIVLNWNGLRDTLDCLESLQRLDYADYEIAVVDNGSTDDSVPVIQRRFPTVTVIESGENLGYAGGNNVGLRWALGRGADHALVLNNDTVVAPDFLRLLVEAAESDATVGIAGPTIYYHDRPDVVWSAGGAIDWRRGRTRMVGLDEQDTGQFGEGVRQVDFLTGCAVLVKRGVLERAGLLDERFFLYYEEAEWCVRVQRAGFKIVHVPRAHIWHKISPVAQADSPLVHYYMTRNHLLFLQATRARPAAWFHTLVAGYLRTWLSWSLRPKWRSKRALRAAMWQGVRDFARGRFGPTVCHSERSEES
jgi:GT2 family glycosyltransferase